MTKRYDLLKYAPFEELAVPAPAKLETTEDYAEFLENYDFREQD